MKNQIVYFVMATFAYASIGCGNTSESGGGASLEGNTKPVVEQKVETDPMFKDANRSVAGTPEGVWTALNEKLAYIKKLTNHDDKMPYDYVLKALEKNTLNVKQPYESVLISAKQLMVGKDGSSAILRRGWVLPIYDGEEFISSWEVSITAPDGGKDGKWEVGMLGAGPVNHYVEFEKANGYWLSSYKKILFPDATLMGKEYVGYVEKGMDLESGRYFKHKEKMDENAASLSWKQLLDQLCEDAEEKSQRVEMGKRLRGIIDKKEAQNEK